MPNDLTLGGAGSGARWLADCILQDISQQAALCAAPSCHCAPTSASCITCCTGTLVTLRLDNGIVGCQCMPPHHCESYRQALQPETMCACVLFASTEDAKCCRQRPAIS